MRESSSPHQEANHERRSTIYAPATAPGRAGVAVLRISGPEARQALAALGVSPLPAPRCAALAALRHPETGAVIDQALVLWFPAPASFTGEDVAELHIHGSRAVMASLLDALSRVTGLRLAEAGEFTRRAYLNGKMDLTEAEGLADLIDAETEMQRAQALRALSGETGARFESLRARIVEILARTEAYIDFPDEDIPESVISAIQTGLSAVYAEIDAALSDGARGERIREGFTVVLLGAPNAGKSSLINALTRRDVAIVSELAGTTRDTIEAHLNLSGLPVTLVDTAGLRESADAIEREGVKRARARAEKADLALVMFDSSALPALDAESLRLLSPRALPVFSKSDSARALPGEIGGFAALPVSALTGEGIPELLSEINRRLSLDDAAFPAPLITRARHREALEAALFHLKTAQNHPEIELFCENLRRSALEIGKITGKIAVDELLDRIFREFCIGK